MMELDCLMPFLSPTISIVSRARHTDGQTRTRQNLIKRYDISIHLRLNHGPCRSHEKRTNSTQLKEKRISSTQRNSSQKSPQKVILANHLRKRQPYIFASTRLRLNNLGPASKHLWLYSAIGIRSRGMPPPMDRQ